MVERYPSALMVTVCCPAASYTELVRSPSGLTVAMV